VPIVALACTLAVYVLSFGTDYKKPFVNTFSFLRMTNGSSVANTTHHFNTYTPQKGDVNVAFSEPVPLSVSTESNYRYYDTSGAVSVKKGIDEYKLLFGDKPGVRFFNATQWQRNSMQAERVVNLPGGLEADVTLVADKATSLALRGVVTNNTGLALEDVTVFLHSVGWVRLGEMQPGETRDLQSSKMESGYSMTLEDLSYNLFGYYYYGYGGVEKETQRQNEIKRGMLQMYAWNNSNAQSAYKTYTVTFNGATSAATMPKPAGQAASMGSASMQITLFAFSRTPVYDGEVLVNNTKPNRFDISLLVMDVTPQLPKGEVFMLPYGVIGVESVKATMSHDFYGTEMYMHEMGSMEAVFRVPGDMALTGVSFEAYDWFGMAGEVLIYNVKDGAWEPLMQNEYFYKDAAAYTDGQNRVRIMAADIGPGYCVLPRISVSGMIQ